MNIGSLLAHWGRALLLAGSAGAFADISYADRVYVSNEDGHTVTVLDAQRAEVMATIEVGKRPRGLKVTRDGSQLFVALSGAPKCPPSMPDRVCAKLERDLKADGIAVVDTARHKVIRLLQAGSDPEQLALSSDGKRLYVANEDAASVSVVDVESSTIVRRIPVGREPEGVVVSPNDRWVLVTNESDNSVSVIDAGTLKVVTTAPVGKRPRDVAFTPDGGMAYVSGELDATLYRMSVPAGAVGRVLQLREDARPMAVSLDMQRRRLYMSTGRGATVAVIAMGDGENTVTLVKEIPTGTRPWGMALSADGRFLYVANGPSNDVSIIDTNTLSVIKRVEVGRSPWGVVIGPPPPEPTER